MIYLNKFDLATKGLLLKYFLRDKSKLTLSSLDKNLNMSTDLNLYENNNLERLINIIDLMQDLKNFKGLEYYYWILLDSCTDVFERINIKKRHKLATSFINTFSTSLKKLKFLEELNNNMNNLKSYVKKNIELLDITEDPLSDLDDVVQMIRDMALYIPFIDLVSKIIKPGLKKRKKHDLDLVEFMNNLHNKLSEIYEEETIIFIYANLIANINNLDTLLDEDFIRLKSLCNFNTEKNILELKKMLIQNTQHRYNEYHYNNHIENNLKTYAKRLPINTFAKGAHKNKNLELYNRDDPYYINLEKSVNNTITYIFIQEFSKRNSNFEYYKNKYLGSKNEHDDIFMMNNITFNKKNYETSLPIDYSEYTESLYEYNYHFTNDVHKEQKSLLFKMDMNLPRNELDKIISNFLDQHHTVTHKIPKSNKAIENKLKKMVDILFIYDGKVLNISNDDIINELYYYNDKTISKATFQKYLKIGIDLIDNKGYLEIANGDKSIFDII